MVLVSHLVSTKSSLVTHTLDACIAVAVLVNATEAGIFRSFLHTCHAILSLDLLFAEKSSFPARDYYYWYVPGILQTWTTPKLGRTTLPRQQHTTSGMYPPPRGCRATTTTVPPHRWHRSTPNNKQDEAPDYHQARTVLDANLGPATQTDEQRTVPGACIVPLPPNR